MPPGPHGVVIAIGGRAALQAREIGAPMVVALAPAYRAESGGAAVVRVAMTPAPERFVSLLAAAGIHRLLAVRSVPAEAEFVPRAAAAGARHDVSIDDEILPAPGGLPALLRRSGPRADAVWLAPDPGSVTPETFAAVREFSRAHGVPFFSPAAGLVMEEVRGDLTVSFRDCGREAALAARELLAGRATAKVVYFGPSAEGRVALTTAPVTNR